MTAIITRGELDGQNTSLTEYTPGEGWSGPRFGLGGSLGFNVSVSTPNVYSGAGAPLAKVRSSSASHSASGSSEPNHHLSVSYNGTTYWNELFSDYVLNNVDFDIAPNTMSTNTIIEHLVIDSGLGIDVLTDYHSVNYVSIDYPHEMDLANNLNYEVTVPFYSPQGRSRSEFENYGGTAPLIYVIGNGQLSC